MAIGLNVLQASSTVWAGRLSILAKGEGEFKPAGFKIDWSGVTAVSGSDVTLNDGEVVAIGSKYLRYGTIIVDDGTGVFVEATDTSTLVPGKTFILVSTITDQDDSSPVFGGAIDGGRVYKARVLAGGAGQPSWANVYAALPRVSYLV